MELADSSRADEKHHREINRLNNILNDIKTSNAEKGAIIQDLIDLANKMNPRDKISLPDDALQQIRSTWKEMTSRCEKIDSSWKQKNDRLTSELTTVKLQLQIIETELRNLRESQTSCCPKITRRHWFPWRKKNSVVPRQVEGAGESEQTKELEENSEALENPTKSEGAAQNKLHHIQDLQSAQTKVDALEYNCHRLEETNQKLRDLVKKLHANLHKVQGSVLDARTAADAAVIATLESNPFTELSIHDVITFHATSVIDNDFKFKEIGRGAFGRVLLARHTASLDTVVIKEPLIPQYFSPAKIEAERRANVGQFTKEAVVSEFLSRSKHFPKLYGTLMLDDNMCVVQEFIGDKKTGTIYPLLNIIKSNPSPFLSPVSLLDIAIDVVEGVGFMHSNGLLHNDIKADNVLLELRNGRWQGFIIDLGLVSTIAFPPRVTIKQSVMEGHKKLSGNVYVAPEVVNDETSLSVASDIYSVGVLLVFIGRTTRLQELIAIGESCAKKAPLLRPRSMKDVMNEVQVIKERLLLQSK